MTIHSHIEGEFHGFDGESVFKLDNGQVWQQSVYKYNYHYAYRPAVVIKPNSTGSYVISIEGMNDTVEVQQIQIVTEGRITSKFEGFNHGMKFQFQNGQVWEQTEGKYKYRYAHLPNAMVIDGVNGRQISVEGVDDLVKVRKVN